MPNRPSNNDTVNKVNNNTNNQVQRIGLFGGTFDPIHLGHIKPLLQASELLNLQQINIIPANIPPHKDKTHTLNEHRINMVKLVCNEYQQLTFDARELERNSPSYTVETLSELAKNYSLNTQLYFFIGMDSLLTFTSWYQWQKIIQLCHLVVSPRPGYQLAELPSQLKQYIVQFSKLEDIKRQEKIIIMPPCLHEISSTLIREKIKQKQDISTLVTPKTAHYIKLHQLYE